jgi:hypothetical protein
VREVLFEGSRAVGVVADLGATGRRELRASVVVDATGQSALIARHFGLREMDPKLRNAAVFSHFKGALRDDGIDEGATLVLHTDHQDSWFWYIPLADDVVSVGVVGPVDYLVSGRSGDLARIFNEEVARCAPLQPRLAGAQSARWSSAPRATSPTAAGRSPATAGCWWGTPSASSTRSTPRACCWRAAPASRPPMRSSERSPPATARRRRLGAFGARFVAGMDAMRRLVDTFYDPNFRFSKLIRQFPDCRLDLISILRGDVFERDFTRCSRRSMRPRCRTRAARRDPVAPPWGPGHERAHGALAAVCRLAMLYLLHNDLWLWNDGRMWMGLPAGLLYHIGFCVAASVTLALLVTLAAGGERRPGAGGEGSEP